MEKTIIEGNRAIAEFMGVTIHDKWSEYVDATYFKPQKEDTSPFTGKPDAQTAIKLQEADEKHKWNPKYHSSWDWLMPVVEKIVKDHSVFRLVIGNVAAYCYFDENDNVDKRCSDDSTITAIWKSVIQFISWYNSQGVKPAK